MKHKTIAILSTVFVLSFSSCTFPNTEQKHSGAETQSESTETEVQDNTQIALEIDERNARKIDAAVLQNINALILEKEIQNTSEIVALYRAKEAYAEGNYAYTLTEYEPETGVIQVVLEETGLADDSVEGLRVIFTLIQTGEYHQVESIFEQYRCWPERGSQEWSKELCI